MESALAVSQAKYWHLKQVGLFTGLADWEIRQLVNIADLRLFKRGEQLFRVGDLAECLYILRTGKVKVYRESEDGKEVIFGFYGPGDVVGEMAVTEEELRQENAAVAEDSFICIIDRDRFRNYLLEHPELALRITRIIAQRTQQAEERVVDYLSKDVRTRLAHALAKLADEFGEEDDDGIRIDLRLTQTELGQLVGSTRETTSMAFNKFRRKGWVDAKDRIIWIHDRESLASY